ncbi:ADP-ribosylglycohydrolase family protein [Halogeometricum borinquense]|nr:ADP-ribosylglycohydrolase family protein [Halogeometricum borinquense]ADQ69100.1 ADP-ribosylglycohydrolase [Halogeometricum borinquense DSM 11551]
MPPENPFTKGNNYDHAPYSDLDKPLPTEGHFYELHPFKSDYELVTRYTDLTGFDLLETPSEHQSSRQLSLQAERIRRTWGLEATADNTIGRDVDDQELITRLDRSIGIILGLACGDALGRPVEFMSSSEIEAEHGTVTKFFGDGSHNQPAGTVTDDTNLALYLVANLLAHGEFNAARYAEQLVEWFESDPFDVGVTTISSITWLQNGVPASEAGHKTLESRGANNAAGNGSVMRCAPLAIAYPDDQQMLQEMSRKSSEITHADPRCTHGCAVLNLTLAAILNGSEEPLQVALTALSDDAPAELVERLERVPDEVSEDDLENSGFVLDTLETALYYGLTADSAEDAIVSAVNNGGDADTIGAVAGTIVGARFGAGWRLYRVDHKPDSTFPARWLNDLRMDIDSYEDYIIPDLLEAGQLTERGIKTGSKIARQSRKLARNSGRA